MAKEIIARVKPVDPIFVFQPGDMVASALRDKDGILTMMGQVKTIVTIEKEPCAMVLTYTADPKGQLIGVPVRALTKLKVLPRTEVKTYLCTDITLEEKKRKR